MFQDAYCNSIASDPAAKVRDIAGGLRVLGRAHRHPRRRLPSHEASAQQFRYGDEEERMPPPAPYYDDPGGMLLQDQPQRIIRSDESPAPSGSQVVK
jgi:hypothetical protein